MYYREWVNTLLYIYILIYYSVCRIVQNIIWVYLYKLFVFMQEIEIINPRGKKVTVKTSLSQEMCIFWFKIFDSLHYSYHCSILRLWFAFLTDFNHLQLMLENRNKPQQHSAHLVNFESSCVDIDIQATVSSIVHRLGAYEQQRWDSKKIVQHLT